jgi:hypothetical protein
MAINASHASLPEVNISLNAFIFSQVLIPNSAPMAGCAVSGQRRCLTEKVTINKAAAYRGWLAYMAVTA